MPGIEPPRFGVTELLKTEEFVQWVRAEAKLHNLSRSSDPTMRLALAHAARDCQLMFLGAAVEKYGFTNDEMRELGPVIRGRFDEDLKVEIERLRAFQSQREHLGRG